MNTGVENPKPLAELAELKGMFEGNGLLGEVVYRTLREGIVRGVLPEGQRVQDRVLAEVLGVSRTPIREAFQRLVAEGLVVNLPRAGLVVAQVTPQDVEDIYIIRAALEGVAARLAAQHASATDIAMLEDICGRIKEAIERKNIDALTALNKEFHATLHRAGHNTRLAEILGQLYDAVQGFRHSTLGHPGRAGDSLSEHCELLSAIKARDADLAQEIAARHMTNAKQVRLEMFRVMRATSAY